MVCNSYYFCSILFFRFCGDETPQVELISVTNKMLVIFKSSRVTRDTTERIGFKFAYSLGEKIIDITLLEDIIIWNLTEHIAYYILYVVTVPFGGCASRPCQNDGDCMDDNDGVVCWCYHGYSGEFCELYEPRKVILIRVYVLLPAM